MQSIGLFSVEARPTLHRRTHRKSKNGCNRCRRRHVRCDETVPQCSKCVKLGLRCDYLDGAPIALLGGRAERNILPANCVELISPQEWEATPDKDAKTATGTRLSQQDRSGPTDLDDSCQVLLYELPRKVSNDHADFRLIRYQPFVSKSSLFPIKGGQDVTLAVEYYLEAFCPGSKPIHHQLDVANPLSSALFPLALQNAELFSAIVAFSQRLVGCFVQNTPVLPVQALCYRGRAINLLRRKLLAPSPVATDAMIMTVLFLIFFEMSLGEAKELDTHHQGLGSMVASRGGLANLGLDGFVRTSLLQTEYYFMLNTAEPPIFLHPRHVKQLTYSSHPFSEEVCKLVSSMSVGFTELALQSRISIETVRTIASITKWQRLKARQRSHKDLCAGDLRFVLEYEPWENIDEMNFCLKCLPQCQKPHGFERALCIALIIYVHIAFNTLVGNEPWTAVYERLQDELTDFIEEYTPKAEERNCMIWIRMLAMAAWMEQFSLKSEGIVLISKLVRESALQGSSWAELEVIFHQFLWSEEMSRGCRSIWEEGIRFVC